MTTLRRLELAREATVRAVVFLAGLYHLAKRHAGPVCLVVDAVESVVTCAGGPLYNHFHDTLLALLALLDRMVDGVVQKLERRFPRSIEAAYAAPEVAMELLAEAKTSGVAAAGCAAYVKAEPAAKALYRRHGRTAGRLAVSGWRSLNKLPLFPLVAQIAVLTAAYWAQVYNAVVGAAASQGLPGAQCVPTIPVKRITKFFRKLPDAVE